MCVEGEMWEQEEILRARSVTPWQMFLETAFINGSYVVVGRGQNDCFSCTLVV